ncbi:hypothetical protein V6N12_013363 [Hibiscus sabdariffa]|uniref:Uncharacterized protein n=1 Tax=Hibiscus sabdariffa TaxID=183260 RepID=A0ABR2D6A8_9ROSI
MNEIGQAGIDQGELEPSALNDVVLEGGYQLDPPMRSGKLGHKGGEIWEVNEIGQAGIDQGKLEPSSLNDVVLEGGYQLDLPTSRNRLHHLRQATGDSQALEPTI